MLFFRSSLFEVGPESAGAHPGPACYKKDGPLAVTDANLALGRLLPEYFPKIFGPGENEPLDKSCTLRALEELTNKVIFRCAMSPLQTSALRVFCDIKDVFALKIIKTI